MAFRSTPLLLSLKPCLRLGDRLRVRVTLDVPDVPGFCLGLPGPSELGSDIYKPTEGGRDRRSNRRVKSQSHIDSDAKAMIRRTRYGSARGMRPAPPLTTAPPDCLCAGDWRGGPTLQKQARLLLKRSIGPTIGVRQIESSALRR